MTSFNLMDEPWITVLDETGQAHDVSIRDLFANSRSYQSLATELPVSDFAILRILLAILHRSWSTHDLLDEDLALDHWEGMWNAESLFDSDVKAYCESVAHRFDLMDESEPFFQVATLHTAKDDWKPISHLFPDVGEPGALFTMATDLESVSAAQAARLLITTMAWEFTGIKSGAVGDPRVKSGRGYPIGIGWAGWLGATTLEGRTLHETLLLNYVAQQSENCAEDLPPWEKPALTEKPEKAQHYAGGYDPLNRANGPVELFTWQQRRIRLKWEDDRAVACLIANGDPVGQSVQFGNEHMTPWRFSEPQSKKFKTPIYMPLQLEQGRAMWRSVDGIIPNSYAPTVKKGIGEGSALQRPAKTIEWLGLLERESILPSDYQVRLRMVSMEYGAQSSSYSNIVADQLTLSSSVFDETHEELRALARTAVGMTDQVCVAVLRFYINLALACGRHELSDQEKNDVRSQFYNSIDHEFRMWLQRLVPHAEADELLAEWQSVLSRTVHMLERTYLSTQPPRVWEGVVKDSHRINAATAQFFLKKALATALGQRPSTASGKELQK